MKLAIFHPPLLLIVVALSIFLFVGPNQAESKINQLLKRNANNSDDGQPAEEGKNSTARREVQSFANSLMNILNETTEMDQDRMNATDGGNVDDDHDDDSNTNGNLKEETQHNIGIPFGEQGKMSVHDNDGPATNKTRHRRQWYYGYGYGGYGYGYGGYGYGYGSYGYGGYGYGYNQRIICGILGCWRIRYGYGK